MSELSMIQMGLEGSGTPGTLVPATYKIDAEGGGTYEFLDDVAFPQYVQGIAQPTIQNAYARSTGTRLTIWDTPCSFQLLAWLLNLSVKTVVGPATSFPFPLPTTAPNTIGSSTFEFVDARTLQEYEFGYGFITKLGLQADCNTDGGVAKVNYVIEGRKSAASTVTGALGFIASREMMNLRTATFKIDALGTAAGTAAATSNVLRSISLDLDTGWEAKPYASARTDLDFAIAQFNPSKMKFSGKMRLYKSATLVTQIANARAGTGIVVQVGFDGTSTLAALFNLPLLWNSQAQLASGEDSVELDFTSGYDSAGSTQGAAINLTLASTTIT